MNRIKLKTVTSIVSAVLISMSLSIGFTACSDNDNTQKLPNRNYELTWSDEFNTASGTSPNAANWKFDLGAGGWGNNEYQVYTSSPDNVSTDGKGNLVITAIKTPTVPYATYTSARILTKGLFTQNYGRFEARIKLPYGPGIWPAFWLLGANIDSLDTNQNPIGWPQCGEIDIMELNGSKPDIIHGTVHGPGYSGGASITKGYSLINDRYDNDFHVFAIEWGENYIDFYVDNYLYNRITPASVKGEWVFNDQPFYILLNMAVGGNYVTGPTDQTPFPQKMQVDYVRVYKEIK